MSKYEDGYKDGAKDARAAMLKHRNTSLQQQTISDLTDERDALYKAVEMVQKKVTTDKRFNIRDDFSLYNQLASAMKGKA